MKVILCASCYGEALMRRLARAVEADAGWEILEFCGPLDRLSAGLQGVAGEQVFVVLVASDKQEMRCLASLREFLVSAEVFMVIPDQDDETFALAHRFRPRYLVTADGDLDDLLAVLLKKMKRARGTHLCSLPCGEAGHRGVIHPGHGPAGGS